MGKVYLIGAGPGNEELVTLKAIRVLKECDTVLYDRLAGGNLLKYLKPECKIFYCGKEPGCHYKTQDEINKMLVEFSKNGDIVGRIKGGDPFVFGRGGEEALALIKEEILFEVIPGVTSAISVLSYAGIPVTHRGISQDFHVFTGMSADKLNVDWNSVAKLNGTLIFLMGLENIEKITQYLISSGKDKSTPAAVVMKGTTSKQRTVLGDLENISEAARKAGLKSPCIIVVGEVVNLSERLNWYEKMPLFGLNICVTRAKEQSKELCEKLIKLGADVLEINAIKIKDTSYNLDKYLSLIEDYDYIILSSVNSVNILFDYFKRKRMDIRKIKAVFAVIGPATESILNERGIMAGIMADEFDSDALGEKLKKLLKIGDKVLIPSSTQSRRVIGKELKSIGCKVNEVDIYSPEIGDIINTRAFDDVDVVLFTSPSGVKNIIKMIPINDIKSKINLAIGPITQRALLENDIIAKVSEIYSTDGMIESLIKIKKEKEVKI